jgi:hypothetical protein
MKPVVGVLGLLIVVAITGFLIKKQFSSGSELTLRPQDGSQNSVLSTTPDATAQQQSQQIAQQVKESIEASMQRARPVPDEK